MTENKSDVSVVSSPHPITDSASRGVGGGGGGLVIETKRRLRYFRLMKTWMEKDTIKTIENDMGVVWGGIHQLTVVFSQFFR